MPVKHLQGILEPEEEDLWTIQVGGTFLPVHLLLRAAQNTLQVA